MNIIRCIRDCQSTATICNMHRQYTRFGRIFVTTFYCTAYLLRMQIPNEALRIRRRPTAWKWTLMRHWCISVCCTLVDWPEEESLLNLHINAYALQFCYLAMIPIVPIRGLRLDHPTVNRSTQYGQGLFSYWSTSTYCRNASMRISAEWFRHPIAWSSPFVFAAVLTIRYDTRCYFNVRSKANMSQLNLPHGTDN